MKPAVTIAPVAAVDLDEVRALFAEYFKESSVDPGFQTCLASQGAQAELAGLPGDYAPPRGRLLLGRVGGKVAGCVALRPTKEEGVAEAKRLFVRPTFRGAGVGRALVERLLEEARAAGYRTIALDTLPSMEEAQELYRRLGFLIVAPSTSHPVAGAVYMRLEL
jgi:putative acetyltransferase